MTHNHTANLRERGFSLLVILIMTVVLAFIALGAMNTSLLQERMAGNANDQNVALQSAEAALRDAETYIATNPMPLAPFAQGCNGGICGTPSMVYGGSGTSVPVWTNIDWTNAAQVFIYGTRTNASPLPSAQPPAYIIEKLNPVPAAGCSSQIIAKNSCSPRTPFRITAHATGVRASTVVTLQSIYLK